MGIIRIQKDYRYASRITIIILLFSVIFIALSAVNAVSADSSAIYVNGSNGNDDWDGFSWATAKLSIKNATGTVTNGGTVNIADGQYSGIGNTNITIDRNMTIVGQSKEGTIINGTDAKTGIFLIQNGTNVTIQNLTIANCTTSSAGSILNNGTLTVNNSIFKDNIAYGGAAISNAGNLTVISSIFKNNIVKSTDNTSIGGAICSIGNLTVTDSTFIGNSADNGGAILNYGNSTANINLNVKNCTFTGNNATHGGAILNFGYLTIDASNFTDNTASSDSGAIYSAGTLDIRNSKFIGNSAVYMGGAILNAGNSTVSASDFTNNQAVSGGAIYNYGDTSIASKLNIKNCNFTSNKANGAIDEAFGGAIFNFGDLVISSSTFTNNLAFSGGAISNFGGNSSVIITGSTFTGNTANFGGAISNSGNLRVAGSNFTANTARASNYNEAYEGGAIANNGVLIMSSSTFNSNTADFGGAVSNEVNSAAAVYSSTFTRNGATIDGDAIYNAGKLTVHFCRIVLNYIAGYTSEDVYNDGGSADVKYNWWGSNAGPSSGRVVGATATPWMVLTVTANKYVISAWGTSTITADLLHDNQGIYHNPAGGYVPNGIPVAFATTLGTIGSQSSTVNGIARSTLKCGSVGGIAYVSAKVDSQTVQIPPRVILTYPKNGATGFSRTATIYIKFSESIKSSINWSKIYVKNLKTGKLVSISKWISGNTLYIKMSSKRYAYYWYQVYIPASAIKDYSGNNLAVAYTFKFKTGGR